MNCNFVYIFRFDYTRIVMAYLIKLLVYKIFIETIP